MENDQNPAPGSNSPRLPGPAALVPPPSSNSEGSSGTISDLDLFHDDDDDDDSSSSSFQEVITTDDSCSDLDEEDGGSGGGGTGTMTMASITLPNPIPAAGGHGDHRSGTGTSLHPSLKRGLEIDSSSERPPKKLKTSFTPPEEEENDGDGGGQKQQPHFESEGTQPATGEPKDNGQEVALQIEVPQEGHPQDGEGQEVSPARSRVRDERPVVVLGLPAVYQANEDDNNLSGLDLNLPPLSDNEDQDDVDSD